MSWRGHPPLILVPIELMKAVQDWNAPSGQLIVSRDDVENMLVVVGAAHDNVTINYPGLATRGHFMSKRERTRSGYWHRVPDEAHGLWLYCLSRRIELATHTLASLVTQHWQTPPTDSHRLVLMCSGAGDELVWSGWWVTREWAHPADIAVISDDRDDLRYLHDVWPVDELADTKVTVVGVGSIGSTVAESLSSAGVGQLVLVDPDRLYEHNLPRHRLTERDIGRFKVNAMRETLNARRPGQRVVALTYNVCDNADLLRPVFADSDVIVCAADGVESRRVTNHLARRANKPLVLAAVLENGAYGELIRVRPRTACLLCQRHALQVQGIFDPEPGIDLGYGTGTRERPMTAAPSDLRLMGEFAAKATISTLLHRSGRRNHRLPGDWAVVALQPTTDSAAPFDSEASGDVTWHEMPERWDDCPTCAPA